VNRFVHFSHRCHHFGKIGPHMETVFIQVFQEDHMFEFHNLGALTAGAVLIGAFQLGGSGLNTGDMHITGAKVVTVSARHATDDRMQAYSGLGAFAQEAEGEASAYEKVMVAWDQLSESFADQAKTVLASITD
jgi:hypothetical protein